MGRRIAVAADDELAPLVAVGPKGGDGDLAPLVEICGAQPGHYQRHLQLHLPDQRENTTATQIR